MRRGQISKRLHNPGFSPVRAPKKRGAAPSGERSRRRWERCQPPTRIAPSASRWSGARAEPNVSSAGGRRGGRCRVAGVEPGRDLCSV